MKSEHEVVVAWLVVVIAVVVVAMFAIAFEPLRKGAPAPAQVVAPPAYVAPAGATSGGITGRELMLMCLHSRARGQGYKCVRG